MILSLRRVGFWGGWVHRYGAEPSEETMELVESSSGDEGSSSWRLASTVGSCWSGMGVLRSYGLCLDCGFEFGAEKLISVGGKYV